MTFKVDVDGIARKRGQAPEALRLHLSRPSDLTMNEAVRKVAVSKNIPIAEVVRQMIRHCLTEMGELE